MQCTAINSLYSTVSFKLKNKQNKTKKKRQPFATSVSDIRDVFKQHQSCKQINTSRLKGERFLCFHNSPKSGFGEIMTEMKLPINNHLGGWTKISYK